MDFDYGASHDQIVARLLPLVEAHAPGRTRAEYERVARWVLDGLINVGTVDRGFRAIYGVFGPDGYQRRTFDFKFLIELVSPDGEIYLRASDEAINVVGRRTRHRRRVLPDRGRGEAREPDQARPAV